MPVKAIPDGYHTVSPYLLVNDANGVLNFIAAAFGGVEKFRHTADGKVTHAEIQVGTSPVMVGQTNKDWPAMPTMLYLYVENVDEVYAQAIKAGGKSLREPTNEFYGDRSCGVHDPFGNLWWIATHVEDVSEEELERRAKERDGTH